MSHVSPVTALPADAPPRLALAAALLDAAIQARRAGTLGEAVRQRPRAVRWLLRHYLDVLHDGLGADDLADCADLMLAWLVVQLRPDARPDFDAIDHDAWLQLPGWRPFLAMASHLTLVPVPDFPRRYRRRPDETPLDNLCGLWDVGPSTVYRWLERSRLAMARIAVEPADATRRLSLRMHAAARFSATFELSEPDAFADWHRQRARQAMSRQDPMSALWHLWQAAAPAEATPLLREHAPRLAAHPEIDATVAGLASLAGTPRARFDLEMAVAGIEHARRHAERELRAYEQALQIARETEDRLLLGIAYGALGRFHETRDADRAFACYQDSAEFLRGLEPEQGDEQALAQFVATHVRLAWLYLQRNDPRSRAVLDRAEALGRGARLPEPLLGLLEQAWGLYWRRSGETERAIEHCQRALNIFERLGDRRSALVTRHNIASDLAQLQHFDRAIAYATHVLDAARLGPVDAELVCGTLGTLGTIHFWQGDYDAAIAKYRESLDHSLAHDLRRLDARTRYNLAEAYYARFRESGDRADEAAGDAFVEDVVRAGPSASSAEFIDLTRKLKSSLLETQATPDPNRLLPAEQAANYEEMQEIARQREILAVPAAPEAHAQAHLAIARAYAAIAAKEREAARALIEREGLQARFASEFTELRQTFERELTREEQVATAWRDALPDLLDDARRLAVVAHLLREGAINKSAYGDAAQVAPATASKHLALLAERGLVVQRGKGPSTRYELPAG